MPVRVIYTGGKFSDGVAETGGKFPANVTAIEQISGRMCPLTVNLPPATMIEMALMELSGPGEYNS
jgi:hypothetical protein